MRMIGATPRGSYRRQPGSHAVRVGIIDTGVDGSHPDIAPNFEHALSRNFTKDNPVEGIDDGPCEHPSCVDPVDEDDDGHGTHVAGTVGAALNGMGMAGVAPKVDLVNIRAGQDSGFFLLQPTLDALTYAGEHGIDVVNMSYFIDPWLFDCAANPADTPEQQARQRTIIEATQRAVDFARAHGVTLVAAEGNESTDLGHPASDDTSPDFGPPPHPRTVTNSCLTEPTEAEGTIAVSAVGPVNRASSPFPRKAFYSNYGVEQTDVAAPGGDSREFFGTPRFNAPENRILGPYPGEAIEVPWIHWYRPQPSGPQLRSSGTARGAGWPLALQIVLPVGTPSVSTSSQARATFSGYFNGFYGDGIVNAGRASR